MSMERLEVAVDREVMSALRREAAAQSVSVAELVREALSSYLDLSHVSAWETDDDLDEVAEEEGEDEDEWAGLERELRALPDDDYE